MINSLKLINHRFFLWDETVRSSQKAFETHCFRVSGRLGEQLAQQATSPTEMNPAETITVCDAKK